MSIFNDDHSDYPYSNRLANLIVKRMTDLVRQDKTPDNKHGIQAIHAVLDTMRKKTYDERTQHVGCSIFAGASQPPEPNESCAAFVFMMDEINDAINTARDQHFRAGWHSSDLYEVLNKISMIRAKQTAILAKQTAILAKQTACCAACANRQRYFAAHIE